MVIALTLVHCLVFDSLKVTMLNPNCVETYGKHGNKRGTNIHIQP